MGVMYEDLRIRYQEIDSSNNINSKQHFYQQNNTDHSFVNNEESLTSTNSEMDIMLSKLIPSNNGWNNCEEHLQEFDVKNVKREEKEHNGDYFYGGNELIYQGFSNGGSNGFYGSFGGVNSLVSKNCEQSKIGVRNFSNLIRQKSSPAGFFSSENGLATLNEESNGTLNFTKCHTPNFTNEFWDNSSFNDPKTEIEDEIMFSTSNALESQETNFSYQNIGLTHHLSLPSPSTKITSIDKFLQAQGTVPCKIRAKRGFATHPRSIAERVRRTRISERIKKLEGLFPKSDKQTSTADMLDLAVEYIKDLQEQVQMLTDCKEKCKCASHEKQHSRHCS